jgi:hypothetical protein
MEAFPIVDMIKGVLNTSPTAVHVSNERKVFRSMLQAVRLAINASFTLALTSTVFAQQVAIGTGEPCMAAFSPLGYPQFNRFLPNDISQAARSKVRGVVARSLLWRPGETIKVCFRSGTQKARARVAASAGEWMQYANLVLDFGDPSNPSLCRSDDHESIKVDFVSSGPKSGFWSAIGTMSRKSDHSLNLSFLGEDDLPRDKAGQKMPEAEARRLVLHEFGHAIGLFHEHQSPKAGCAAEYYEEAIFAYGALRGWPPEKSVQNFRQIADTPEFNATEVDRKSIMHYSLPPWLFKGGEKSPCVVKPNFELSEGDKEFIKKVYPKSLEPQVVATGPTVLTTRSSSARAATFARDKLVQEFKSALQEAGVEHSKIESLAKEFATSLPGR